MAAEAEPRLIQISGFDVVGFAIRTTNEHEMFLADGMTRVQASSGKYLTFSANDRSPQAIRSAWQNIWTYFSDPSHPKRSYTTDFEKHTAAGVSIWIAVL